MFNLLALAATASILIQVTPISPSVSQLDITVTDLSQSDTHSILEQVLQDLNTPSIEVPPIEVPEGEDLA